MFDKKNFGLFALTFFFIFVGILLLSSSAVASGCSVSVSGISQHPSDDSWPYWAEGNVSSSIGFSAPDNVTFYHFTSALYFWSDSVSPQWVYVGGCSPLDFGDFSGNLPQSPFDWHIGYLNEGEYKLEIGLYCHYLDNTTSLNCSDDTETFFSVSDGSSSEPSGSLSADFVWSPQNPSIFESMVFQSTSQVLGGVITEYEWYLDGMLVSSGYDSWEWTSPTEGNHSVELVIGDSNLNSDSISFSFEVESDQWFLLDAATGKGVMDSAPWEVVERSSSFVYGDDIVSWAKLGNVSKQLSVDFVWTSPDFVTVRSMSSVIEDPASYGYGMWESFAVWDNLSVGMPLYETIFQTPGLWSVALYVDGSAQRVLDFSVDSSRTLLVSLDKSKAITGEEVVVSGSVLENSMPVSDTSITVELYRGDVVLSSFEGIGLDVSGNFNVSFVVPVVEFSSESVEPWSVRVFTVCSKPGVAVLSESISFDVLLVRFNLVDVKLVQIIETPDFSDWGGSYPYLALNRPAVVRVSLNCSSWTQGFSVPKVEVMFSYTPFVGSASIVEEFSVSVTNESTNLDIPFTLSSEGSVLLEVDVDPYHRFSDPLSMSSYVSGLHWEDEIISKQMKSLLLRFVPIDIPSVLDDPSQLSFVKKQVDFIRDVYPIPNEDIKFRCCYRYDAQVYEQSKWTLVNTLATKNLLGNYGDKRVVLVGVTPESWWDVGDQGMALGKYVTSAVIVKNNSEDVSVTGHEVGHTLGLRVWTEEYDISNYYSHLFLDGLISKDGKIINLSIRDEYIAAFPNLIKVGRRNVGVTFYCMMGNSRYSWICEQDYIKLFRALKDPPSEQCVLINGWVTTDDSVSVDRCFLLDQSCPDVSFEEGDFYLEVISSSGAVLYSDMFGAAAGKTDPFSFVIPWFVDAASIELKKDDVVLQSVVPSNNTPSVSLLSPLGGISFDEVIPVSWQGFDGDGDDLSFTVFFSHDGLNWEVINADLNDSSVDIDARYVPGGSSCRVRVLVSDGFFVDMVDSDPFVVSKKEPVCAIIDGASPLGVGYDLEDGELLDSSLQWFSDVQGFVGSGDELSMQSLQLGSHVISLKATDSDGNSVEESFELWVSEDDKNSSVETIHVFCLDVEQDGSAVYQKSVFSSDELLYSLISFSDVGIGDEVSWVFSGPNQQSQTLSVVFESSGAMFGFAPLDLATFSVSDSVGVWTVDVYLNDVFVISDSFSVVGPDSTPLGIELVFLAVGILVFYLNRKQ